ncbi:TPA: hypothetical protein ACKP7W_000644 [Stenotrophomonas maltophilia]
MSNDKTALADVKPGGRVRLGDQAERARFEQYRGGDFERDAHGYYTNLRTSQDWAMWQGALSAQPSPGGQGDASPYWPEVDRILVDAYVAGSEGDEFDMIAARNAIHAALAARQPVGALHLPPDGFYKIVFDDAEVPDESFARSGALDAALRRFEQISNKWNAHLFVRFANNTRDCTVPNATPAQAVDQGPVRDVLQRRIEQWRSHLPADPGAPGTREIETKGEPDYNNDVRIYRDGIAVMEEVLSKIDSQAVGK